VSPVPTWPWRRQPAPSTKLSHRYDLPVSATSETEINIHSTAGKLADLERRVDEAVHAGSARAVEKQHARGKKTARERIELLLDEGSFVELDELARHRSNNFGLDRTRPYGDGVVTGYGTVDGCACSPRTSPSSAARSARSSGKRSSRSWTWR
jgi:propionyl-CoA carboxylase beta chain